jgi:hypothetical protein
MRWKLTIFFFNSAKKLERTPHKKKGKGTKSRYIFANSCRKLNVKNSCSELEKLQILSARQKQNVLWPDRFFEAFSNFLKGEESQKMKKIPKPEYFLNFVDQGFCTRGLTEFWIF